MIYICFYIVSLLRTGMGFKDIGEMILTPIHGMVILILGICFIAVIFFPIHSQLKENVLSSISRDS